MFVFYSDIKCLQYIFYQEGDVDVAVDWADILHD